MPQCLARSELVALARSFRLPLGTFSMPVWLQLRPAGGPTISPWLAMSTGSLLRTAYRTLPEFERLHAWLYRQHRRL
eukprot:3464139-Pyramimonas_sp.AAC.1